MIPGLLTERDREILPRLAKLAVPECGIAVEVGSFLGASSDLIAQGMPESATLHCIDTWKGNDIFRINEPDNMRIEPESDVEHENYVNTIEAHEFWTGHHLNIKRHQETSPGGTMSRQLQDIDFLFLDESHVNPTLHNAIYHWLPRMNPNGIIAGHDFFVQEYPDVQTEAMQLSVTIDRPIWLFGGRAAEAPCLVWAIPLGGPVLPI